MTSIADQLPPEIARRIHPEWRRNEAAYWQARDQLLGQYEGLWIGFDAGIVVASGTSPVEVLHAARAAAGHPFVICVGYEDEPSRIRRVTYSYDTRYRAEPLPQIEVEFRRDPDVAGVNLNRVIPDTGADSSVLPWTDCIGLQLDPNDGTPSYVGGVSGSSSATVAYDLWAWIYGRDYRSRVQVDFEPGAERILGRDVLNQLEALFRGPAREVVINP